MHVTKKKLIKTEKNKHKDLVTLLRSTMQQKNQISTQGDGKQENDEVMALEIVDNELVPSEEAQQQPDPKKQKSSNVESGGSAFARFTRQPPSGAAAGARAERKRAASPGITTEKAGKLRRLDKANGGRGF